MRYAVKLFKLGAELCDVLAFRGVDEGAPRAERAPELPIASVCCFTVPVASEVTPSEHALYELVFHSGARFPIRICEVQLRFGGSMPSGRDVFAEVI